MKFRNTNSQWSRIALGLQNFNLDESEEFYQRANFYSVELAEGKDCSLDVFVAMGVPETDWSYAFTLQVMPEVERVRVFELTSEGETIVRQDIVIDLKP
jgi:hypothetical protein